jgi:hypothetical protein
MGRRWCENTATADVARSECVIGDHELSQVVLGCFESDGFERRSS